VGLLYATGPKTGELVQLVAATTPRKRGRSVSSPRNMPPFPAWVTFNGKSFDVPSLRLRYAFHRLSAPLPEEHVDLLHIARRHFRGVLPDCKLRTLERRVCGAIAWTTSTARGCLMPTIATSATAIDVAGADIETQH